MTSTLSPAAYAIVAAAHREGHTNRLGLAAALRAVARYCKRDTLLLLDLADELEGT